MLGSAKGKLNAFYENELDALRSSGAEFSKDYPKIAKELELSSGVSRDPHVEHLVQSFAWMMARLQLQMESESRKLPSMLVQELEPSLISAKPSMAIAECEVDIAGIDLTEGHCLRSGQMVAPVQIEGSPEEIARLQNCRFSLPVATNLWPFRVAKVRKNTTKESSEIDRLFSSAQSFLTLTIEVCASSAPLSYELNTPLRFFINSEEGSRFKLYDLFSSSLIGVAFSDDSGRIVRKLGPKSFRLCGFDDEDRMLPQKAGSELGISLLQDYFAFPEKFLFFEIDGLSALTFEPTGDASLAQLNIHLILDQVISPTVPINDESIKLNCFPVINLFNKKSEPIVVHEKNYKYRLTANRSYSDDYEIHEVGQVYAVDNQGVQQKVEPYYSLQAGNRLKDALHFVAQKEESHRRNVPGSETWVSVFRNHSDDKVPNGVTIFSQSICSNRALCEQLPVGQQLSVVGAAPVKSLRLLTRPSLYSSADLSSESHWKLFTSLSRYHLSLNDHESAMETLVSTLSLCINHNDSTGNQLLRSIESCEATEHHVPSKVGGWRGYHQGTKFKITLNERKFVGSPMLFGRVLLQFLALFCPINSFATLELYIGSRRVHQWPPMNGHMALV